MIESLVICRTMVPTLDELTLAWHPPTEGLPLSMSYLRFRSAAWNLHCATSRDLLHPI